MPQNVTQKLVLAHLVHGKMRPGEPILIRIDQTLTQGATGTLVMLALESIGLDRARTELSAQYVDHNLLEADHLNADDHLFLESACRRFGLWYSRAGNGISHVVHMQHFGKPVFCLISSASRTMRRSRLLTPWLRGPRRKGCISDGVLIHQLCLARRKNHRAENTVGSK